MIPPLSKLKEMILVNIEDVESLLASSKSMISLKDLKIYSCSKLKSIFPGIQHLTSLQRLRIDDCDNVNSSGLEGICSLTSLEELTLKCCNGLSTLPQEIVDCPHLEEFIRNSRFSILFEETKHKWRNFARQKSVHIEIGFLSENRDGEIKCCSITVLRK